MIFQNRGRIKIHGNIGEGCLKAHPGRDVDVENKFLQRLFHLPVFESIIPNKRSQQRIKIRYGLRAGGFPLQRVEKIDNLSQRGAQVFGRCAFHLSFDALETLPEQILQIPAHAIDRKQAEIVYMNIAVCMGAANFPGINGVEPVFGCDIRRNVVVQPLQRIAHIAVFFNFPIQLLNIVIYQVDMGPGGHHSDLSMLFAV